MIGRAMRIMVSSSGDVLLWVFAAYGLLDIINPWPDFIYGAQTTLNTALVRFFSEKFHWLTLLVLFLAGAGYFFRGFNTGGEALRNALFTAGLLDDENMRLPILESLKYSIYREHVALWALKGATFMLIAYYAARAEWAARGLVGT